MGQTRTSLPARAQRLTLLAACCLTLLLGLAPQARAERADRDKPTNVEADQLVVDDLKQVTVFTGTVVLTKGTMIIRSDQMTVREDPEGYQFGTAVANAGKLVFYRQKREGLDQYIEGVAERMEYDGKTEKIKLFNRAIIKRLEGSAEADEVRGDQIEYDSRTEIYTVQGGKNAGSSDGRVRAVIQPRNKPAAPAKAAPLELKPATGVAAPRVMP